MHKWYEAPGIDRDVVFASRIRMVRNLSDLPFPVRMSASDRERVCLRVEKALSTVPDLAWTAVFLDEQEPGQAVSLVERQLCSAEFIAEPQGRAVFYTHDESLCVLVNGIDHVSMQGIASGSALPDVLNRVNTLDTVLDRTLRFAFHTQLGYLTQRLDALGTGLQPSVLLFLPALQQGGAVEQLSGDVAQLGFSLRGLFDSAIDPAGACYELTNRISFGISEADAVKNLLSISGQLCTRERQARTAFLQTEEAQDAVGRALAVLASARALEFSEFLRLYASVRMGVCAGQIGGVRVEQLDSLLFAVEPATLLQRAGKPLSAAQQQERRAQFCGAVLSAASFLPGV